MRGRTIVAAGAAALLAAAGLGVRFNASPSVARGLYLQRSSPLERGGLVLVCLPETLGRWARSRGYLGAGPCPAGAAALGKRVAALGGDRVTIGDRTIAVNGKLLEDTEREARDGQGRPVPLFDIGEHLLAAGEIWLHAGGHRRSLDSRVFGPVPASCVRSTLVPLLVLDSQ